MGQKTLFPNFCSLRPHTIMVRKALHVLCFLPFLQMRAGGKFCDTHKHTPLLTLAFKDIIYWRTVQCSCGTTFYVLPMNLTRNAEEPSLEQVTRARLSRDQNFLPFSEWREKEVAVSNNICKQPTSEKKEFPSMYRFVLPGYCPVLLWPTLVRSHQTELSIYNIN